MVPDPTNIVRVRGSNGTALTSHPLQFGRPFVAGEIPGCAKVLLNGAQTSAQIDVKSRHPDGSVRFAVVSTVLQSVPAGATATLTFARSATCEANTPISLSQMLASNFNFDAQIALNGGAAGTASARRMLSNQAYTTWTAGPVATTAIIADHNTKTYDLGPDANRSLRPMFETQFWPSLNRTRVRVILEAVDTEKVQNQIYDVTVRMGSASPQTVLSAAGVNHNYMSRWTRVFWIGGAPQPADIDYGVAYLAKTRALPNYDPSIALSGTTKNALVSAWSAAPKTLFAKGLWGVDMREPGGRADLGPYPKWVTAWLYDGSAALRDVALGQADLAASWPVHLREGNAAKRLDRDQAAPALGLPVSGYARPTLTYQGLTYPYTVAGDRVKIVGALSNNGWIPDVAHEPQPFFVPYVLTGEHFYKEQLHFWATYSLLDQSWGLYGQYCYSKNATPKYLGIGGQVRGWAWGFRMLSEAAWATPDTEPTYKAWLKTAVEDVVVRQEGMRGIVRDSNNTRLDWKWANSTGDCSRGSVANGNPLHYWSMGNSGYGGNATIKAYEATWQYSFVMYALTRAYELGFPAGKLREWTAHYFHSAIANGGLTGYHLADYTVPVLDAQTGTFYQSWNVVNDEYTNYAANKAWPPNTTPNSSSTSALDQGYGTVALTALASTYGIGDAGAAWSGFAAKHYAAWGWSADPKWAIVPRTLAGGSVTGGTAGTGTPTDPVASTPTEPTTGTLDPTTGTGIPSSGNTSQPSDVTPTTGTSPAGSDSPTTPAGTLPAWLANAAVYEWREIPGTRLDATSAWKDYTGAPGTLGKYGILAYSGGALKKAGSELFIAGGGHRDYAGNEIFSIALNSATPQWVRRINPSTQISDNTPYYPDGRPSSRHTYGQIQFVNARNRLMFFGMAPWADLPTAYDTVDGFDPATNRYDPAGTYPTRPGLSTPASIGKDAQENIYAHSVRTGNLYKWTQATNTWADLGYRGAFQHDSRFAVDTKRNRIFRPKTGTYGAAYYDLNNNGAVIPVTVSGPAAATAVNAAQVVYDPINDVFWLWRANDTTLYRIDAATFNATIQPVSGVLPRVAYIDARHNIYGRFSYVPELRGLVFMLDASGNLFFIRTAN